MPEESVQKKDVLWQILGNEYRVLNVPHYKMNLEEYFDIDVTFKLAMIRDLMITNEIPKTVNFEEIADFTF
ncbi:hypothetical protein LI012_14655 [Caldibacillus thermoamylovorans]|uniref:hypothetical protein n=1 Tax=Caldibacillus thermoamylovorans TaxID=35841 RepID=UPI001D08AD64|nr:hypothetical protein [Caldibacillus thermoamylovorans]MCB5936616.1 hypothetical protein [Bacillus sp. DFI.2.34]MCB7078048.1 hypothetical protein [Caldibacillus thermoamylovorans]